MQQRRYFADHLHPDKSSEDKDIDRYHECFGHKGSPYCIAFRICSFTIAPPRVIQLPFTISSLRSGDASGFGYNNLNNVVMFLEYMRLASIGIEAGRVTGPIIVTPCASTGSPALVKAQ